MQTASRKLRDLADVVLAERFVPRWGVAGVAAPPAAAPAFAAASPVFVQRHQLAGRESLAALAVRYGTRVNELKRINNLLTESGVASRRAARRRTAAPVAAALNCCIPVVLPHHCPLPLPLPPRPRPLQKPHLHTRGGGSCGGQASCVSAG